MTSGLDNLTPNTETYEFDATVTCLSQNAKDNEVAEHIQQYLKAHDQHVVYLEASEGQKQQLGTARWNIFVISKQSFEEAKIKIHPILATDRCAENKCSHILYVITELNMDVIPYSLNWATMINTEQNDYEELILNQIEGRVDFILSHLSINDFALTGSENNSNSLSW